MRAVREHYTDVGIESRLHIEEFTPALAPITDVGGTVHFASSGLSRESCGASLLEQAEAAGLHPEHGCRMGICFSCTTTKTSGRVRDLRTGETDDDPDHPIQLCVSAPVGDVTLDL